MERPSQRRPRGGGRGAGSRSRPRRGLRRGCRRDLARGQRLGRDGARRLGRRPRARCRARGRCRRLRALGARRPGRGRPAVGVVRPGVGAVPRAAAHPGRHGGAGAARRRRTRRDAPVRAPRGHGGPGTSTATDSRPRRGHDFDPADYVWPAEVAAVLLDGWHVEVDELRPRHAPESGAGAHHADDLVLRVRRPR